MLLAATDSRARFWFSRETPGIGIFCATVRFTRKTLAQEGTHRVFPKACLWEWRDSVYET